jgi:hypothetical protein
MPGLRVVADDGQVVGRGYVPTRREIRRRIFRRHPERDPDLGNIGFELGAPAHDCDPTIDGREATSVLGNV